MLACCCWQPLQPDSAIGCCTAEDTRWLASSGWTWAGATKNGVPTNVLGKKATLLQFSTEYCGQCPGVRRQLAQLEYRLGGLSHLEVDITERIEIAAKFNISQTPTIFVLNPSGEIVYRVGGVPKLPLLMQELEKLGVK